jgi:hypothetical protein
MSVPTQLTVYINNDQFFEIDGLVDGLTLSPFNDATVTVKLIDKNNLLGTGKGATVTGFPLTLTYIAGSNGNYRGKLPHSVSASFVIGGYTAQFDMANASAQAHIEITVVVAVRKA